MGAPHCSIVLISGVLIILLIIVELTEGKSLLINNRGSKRLRRGSSGHSGVRRGSSGSGHSGVRSDIASGDYRPEEDIDKTYNYDESGGGVYKKVEDIVYPFQQYVQVRHSHSVEHLPTPEADDQQDPDQGESREKIRRHRYNNLDTSASTNSENSEPGGTGGNDDDHGGSSSYDQASSYVDHKPRLTEEIDQWKKQEVYEEKGYADGAYDHAGRGQHYGDTYKWKGNGRGPHAEEGEEDNRQYQENNEGQAQDDQGEYQDQESRNRPLTHHGKRYHHHQQSKPRPLKKYKRHRPPPPPSYSSPHLSTLPTSTKILEFAASNLYDKEAHEKGVYLARDNIHCPEVIDFDLSSKKMGMGKGTRRRGPRLQGLGSKIKCLKEKYWGKEPLPKEMFQDPSESRRAAISIPTFDQFYSGFRDEIGSKVGRLRGWV